MIVNFKLIFILVFLILSLGFISSVNACSGKCYLDIHVWDQDTNALEANIYVNNSYKGYNDHVDVEVDGGTYTVEATKFGYDSDSDIVTCPSGETKRVDLILNKKQEEIKIRLGNLNVDPDEICWDEDETIELSIPVTLESGYDGTEIIAKFYVEENGNWDYIGKDEKELDRGETRTFEIDYEYDAYDLYEGRYDLKVVVTAGDAVVTRYADLYVEDCRGVLSINVGFIDLDPSRPNKGDIVQVKVPVTLESSKGSERVYVYAYVDDVSFYTTSKIMDEGETARFRFTLDTEDYSTGSHTIRVKARVNGETDSSSRSFTIGRVFAEEPYHCLSIDNIRIDRPLQPGTSVKVLVDVMSCGDADEDGVRAKVEAFSRTYYTGLFDIISRQTREVFVTVSVPDDISGKQAIKVTVWNEYATDSWSKDFAISTGIPFIEIEKEFPVEACKTEKITFAVVNTGEVSDTFTLKVTGPDDWITGVPEAVTLEPDESRIITAYVSVPCETELGYYEFTVTAQASSKYSATSSIRVIKPWTWPTLTFRAWSWLLWVLLLLFIIIIVVLLAFVSETYISRRRPMFE